MDGDSIAVFNLREFTTLKKTIASNILIIKSSWQQLEKAIKVVGTARDTPESRKKNHTIQTNTNQKITETSLYIEKLTYLTQGDRQKKIDVEQLKTNFKDIVERYSKSQQVIAAKMKQVLLVNPTQYDDDIDEQTRESRASRIASFRVEDLEFEQALALERQRQMQQIEADVIDLHKIYQHLNELVHIQGEQIDHVTTIVEGTEENVTQGMVQLNIAESLRNKSRKKLVCIVLIILTIVGISIGVSLPSAKKFQEVSFVLPKLNASLSVTTERTDLVEDTIGNTTVKMETHREELDKGVEYQTTSSLKH